ncbi:hypothetical protein [Clostridium butyricum]|uniref:hypothetical protein n=1 Tax=Clostridium butyricum TaxID=1492 RepID=UPI0022E1AC86|nr:hypothetical protein [Clostridium butyricum]
MEEVFWSELGEIKDYIKDTNIKLNKILKNNKNTEIIASPQHYSIRVSESLLEGVETIKILQEKSLADRYINSIIRNMAEQIIEYKYIIEIEPKLISIYFGEKIDDNILDNETLNKELSIKDMLEILKKTGEARYKNGNRKSVSKMADDICEKDTIEDENNLHISLYDIFSYEAEMEHNSYFNSFIDDVGEFEGLKENYVDPLVEIFLYSIFESFFKTYDTLI